MAVPPNRGGSHPQHMPGWGFIQYLLESERRDVMTFINYYLAVVAHEAVHFAPSVQGLEHSNVEQTFGTGLATADLPHGLDIG